ncbi:homocysteine S-methyltransferase family protein [Amaricoccus macauensis]|uniref:homocysteine S-methyltransferase family protein n=1 Tax=Amaricoccus macauensis TaxID=57001 RepID=UPI003C7ABED8
MTMIDRLISAERPFLADGGLETTLFFIDGFEAPEFAAIMLMDDPTARAALDRYFDRFLAMTERAQAGFILDTNTWRGCVGWADKLGVSETDLIRLTRAAVGFAHEVRDRWQHRVSPIILNGVVGPSGDGYAPETELDAAAAEALHRPQIAAFAEEGVDMMSAITMTHVGEAAGIARAAQAFGLPVVISFTVETDGRLPNGETIGAAIEATDAKSGGAPLYYMVNCAHPDHFRSAFEAGEPWVRRVGGLRANASRLSHAELDAAETLDDGDPLEFGRLHAEMARYLPNLRVVGGCCGTDHRHVGCVSEHLHGQAVA